MRMDILPKTVVFSILGFCCLCMLHGCHCQESEDGIVARVNGTPISFIEFWDEFKSRYQGAADPTTLQPDVLETMKAGLLSDLIRQRLLLQEARRREIRVPLEVLDARIEEMQKGYSGPAFQKLLLAHHQDYEQFRAAVESQLMIEELYREVVAGVGAVTDEEVGRYYDDNLDEFLVPETVRMSQILVKDRPQAAALLKRIRKGEDFAALAEEHSQVRTETEEGGLKTYRKGELPEALEQIAFSARTGRVTGPVETYYGFHLIKVQEKVPAHLPALEDVKDRIKRGLRQQREEERYARWVEKLIGNSRIQVHGSLKEAILAR